jgi:hypothetical protein
MGRYCTLTLPEFGGEQRQMETLSDVERFGVYVTRPQKAGGGWSGDTPAPGFGSVAALYFRLEAPATAPPTHADVILPGDATPTRFAWAWIHSATNIAVLPHATQAGRMAA